MTTRQRQQGAIVATLTAAMLASWWMPASADSGTQSVLTATEGHGAGHVKVEPTAEDQGTLVNQVTVNVEGLAPNQSYDVERAVDRTPGDGVCTIAPGPPLGWTKDATITTSPGGAGAVHYDVHRTNVPSGTSLDIIFRVTANGTELRSACMTFTAK